MAKIRGGYVIAGLFLLVFGISLAGYIIGTSKSICPAGLQRCSDACIPANSQCSEGGSYCLEPVSGITKCNACSNDGKMCGMFCIPKSQKCCIAGQCEMTTSNPIETEKNYSQSNKTITISRDNTETKVIIESAKCSITSRREIVSGVYMNTYTAESSGTAQGPIGTRFIIEGSGQRPLGNIVDCGEWTMRTDNREPEYYDCERREGEPATTTWKARDSIELASASESGEIYPNINSGSSNQKYGTKIIINC